ncbi:MAG: response regulator [Glaciecola sp.]
MQHTNSTSTVLIVEDEIKIAQLLSDYLIAAGFKTRLLHDGAGVIDHVKQTPPDFLVLDVMLPNVDGLTLCKQIREFSDVPILMLTARVEEIDRLMGLGFGADDYVCKPFSSREVVARVEAILKRVHTSNTHSTSVLKYKHIRLDKDAFECFIADDKVVLTPVEFRLLQTLITKPKHVFSRDVLMQKCYSDERIVSHRTIDSHMANLRQKTHINETAEHIIHTVYGVGYKAD